MGGGKITLPNTSYYTEDTKKGGIKRNVSNGDCDFQKEEVMSSWVIAAALSASPTQRVGPLQETEG